MNILTSYHPALLALQSLYDQFPGALTFYLYCMDDGIKALHNNGKNKSDFIPQSIETADDRPAIQRFRKMKKEVYWGDLADLPVRIDQIKKSGKTIKQLSIQDEIEQNILIIRVPSLKDDTSDVFVIQFSKTFSNFYIASGRNSLSSELKQSLGKTIRGQLIWIYQLYNSQSENVRRIQKAYLRNTDELISLKEQLKNESAEAKQLLEKYVNGLIQSQGQQLNCMVEVEANFIEHIKRSKIPIENLEEKISSAMRTAYDLSINPNHIQLNKNLIESSEEESAPAYKRSTKMLELDKTKTLLSKYETAARQIENNGIRINGKNLAEALNISGPAITDAIKKHRHKIQRLLEKYPQEWPLISDYIRPIREIKEEIRSVG
ncbi:MAG: hypothetical protein ACPG21_01425 [Crocinitomicaceae bacterium]